MAIESIRKGLHQIPTPFDVTGTVFLYVLKGERVALVDTGVADSPTEVIQPALAEIGMAIRDVEVVLTTHAHLDHAGGNAEVKRLSSARTHVHEQDVPLASSVEAEIAFHTTPLRRMEYPPDFVREREERVQRLVGTAAGADVVLQDGDGIDLGAGIRLRVVHMPGHTPGHVAYLWEAEGIAFTGDSVQGEGARPGGYPLYFDAPGYRKSITRLQDLDCRMLCLGHAFRGGTLINNPVRQGSDVGAFLKGAASVADTIHRTVADTIGKMPGASKRDVALAALGELIYEIPQLRQRRTGMPMLAGPTFSTHIDAAIAGTYPA